jgi:hypothetical protein
MTSVLSPGMHLKILILMQRGRKNSSVGSRENSKYPCQWPTLQIISLYLIRLSLWTTTSRKRRTVKGSSVTARAMWNYSTRSTTHLRAVDLAALTSMGFVSIKEMVATSTTISIGEVSRETAPMGIMVDTMVSIATTLNPRKTSLTSPVSSERRLVIIPPAAQKTRPLSLPSPIHFRRAK